MPYSCLDEQIRTKFSEYVTAYNKAERALKNFEVSTSEGLIFPSVNELRCAGQHIARAFSAESVEVAMKDLELAIRHARRAQYDAYDAGINYSLAICRQFQEDYKRESIADVHQGYSTEKLEIEQIVRELAAEDRRRAEEYIEQKERQLTNAKEIAQKWESIRDELNKKISQRRRTDRIQIWTLIATILAVGVAIYFGVNPTKT